MFWLVRKGYGIDLLAFVLVSALLGGVLVGGVGRAVERHFHGAVDRLIGAPGEYDVLVHLQEDVGVNGINALSAQIETLAPGFTLRVGPTLAGRINVFLGFPPASRNRAFFESLEEHLRDVPGFDGHTVVIEPSVIIQQTHPRARARLMAELETLPEVAFAFRHGNSLWAVAHSREHAARLRSSLEERVGELHIVDVRPLGDDVDGAGLAEYLAAAFSDLDVEAFHADPQTSGTVHELIEVRRLLEGVTSQSSLAQRLGQVAAALEEAAGDGAAAMSPVDALAAFESAIDHMQELQQRLNMLSEQLATDAADGVATEVLVGMLLQNLIGSLRGEASPPPSSSGVDVEALRAGINQLTQQLAFLSELDLGDLALSLRQLEGAIGGIDQDTLNQAMATLDRLIDLEGGTQAGVELLVEGRVPRDRLVHAVQSAPGLRTDSGVFVRPAGVVEADARTALMLIVDQARHVIVVLVALLYTMLLFFLDAATLLSFIGTHVEQKGRWRWTRQVAIGVEGGLWFALTMSLALVFAGGVVSAAGVATGSFLIGMVMSWAAHRLSPIDREQLEAALSLGMPTPAILRRVVIPAARPGVLWWQSRFAWAMRERFSGR